MSWLLVAFACISTGADNGKIESTTSSDSDLFHTIFPVECKLNYLLWQTVGLWYSFRKAKQPGSFTRLLACPEEGRDSFRSAGGMDICPTFVTPSYTHYTPGDHYGPVSEPTAASTLAGAKHYPLSLI